MKQLSIIISILFASSNLFGQCSVTTTSFYSCTSPTGTATAHPTGQAPFVYSWNTNPIQTTQIATGLNYGTYIVTVTDANSCIAKDTITISQLIIDTMIVTPESCNGCNDGSITVIPAFGTPPYSYLWSPTPGPSGGGQTITGLVAGTYICTVTDSAGCFQVRSTTVQVCSVTVISTDVTCAGLCDGTATAIGTGQAPFTYSWNTNPVQTSQSISNLCAGTYVVACTDGNACTSFDTVTINSPTVLSISATATPTCFGCNTGSATATVSGGTPAYSYFWSPPASVGQGTATPSNLPCGTYTCTVTDLNGCTATTLATIFCCSVTTTSTPNCYNDLNCTNANGTATATPTGQAPFIYSWNTNPVQTTQTATGLCAGYYTITVTDANNCTSTDSVRVYPVILNTISTTPVIIICDGTATAHPSGSTTPYTYSWSPTFPIQTSATATGLCTGITYTVCITSASGCITCDTATLGFTTSIENFNSKNNFEIYPNPSNGAFIIKAEKSIEEMQITNLLGEMVYRKNAIHQKEFKMDGLAKGTYIIAITDNNNYTSFKKIIVNP